MAIDTKHLEYTIEYDEEKNEWRCWTLGITGKSLRAVKDVLSKRDANERRVGDLPAFRVTGYRTPDPCVITLIADDKQYAWIRSPDGKREKVRITELVLDTPEVRATIKEAQQHRDMADIESKKGLALLSGLPRVHVADLTDRETVAQAA